MSIEGIERQYLTYDGRLASFQTRKKRGSSVNGRGAKALNWPHKTITPESLALAGFSFQPHTNNPDNVVCFLCTKNIDGWEAGDDPLHEHLKHSPECGWAIVAAIEADIEEYVQEDPGNPLMVEARKATFSDRWPHDKKRGWKCKTKQLVEAGWKYTPQPDSDDLATCTYCDLSLDGWEPGDKPLDEHYKRSPNCVFFALVERYKGTKKTARGKTAIGSKASRLSTQSNATVASEAPSLADTTAAFDDTVLTTASTMGTKKGRVKKATTGKGKKTKAKKEEPAEIIENPPTSEVYEPLSPAPAPPTRAKRGKKRGSDAIDESTMVSEAPVPKKRAIKTRISKLESSVIEAPEEDEMTDVPVSKQAASKKKGRASNIRKPHKAATTASSASMRAPNGQFPDDDEIERQLELDLERPLTDDEDITADFETERSRLVVKTIYDRSTTPIEELPVQKSESYAMFDPSPPEPDEAELDYELEGLRAEMDIDEPETVREPEPEPEMIPEPEMSPEPEPEPEPKQLQVPKKGRKAGNTRKASKQTKAKKAPPPPPPIEEDTEIHEPQYEEEVLEDQDVSLGSTDTVVVKKSEPLRASVGKKPRGRPSKASRMSQVSIEEVALETNKLVDEAVEERAKPPKKRSRGRPSKASLASAKSVEFVDVPEEPIEEEPVEEPIQEEAEVPAEPPKKRGRGRPSKASVEFIDAPEEPIEETVQVSPAPLEPLKKRGRGRPSKASLAANALLETVEAQPAEPPVRRGRGRPPKKSLEAKATPDAGSNPLKDAQPVERQADEQDGNFIEEQQTHEERAESPVQVARNAPIISPVRQLPQVPYTPGRALPSRQLAFASPSQSPQASDAENLPPSLKAAASAHKKRVVLAPVTATPICTSPSKRNVLAGLKSSTPWNAVDIDRVMGTPLAGHTEAATGVERLLAKGKELTSPEKQMTVEEWILHNARQAESILKAECEDMVSRFEIEGGRAMKVLEGLVVNE